MSETTVLVALIVVLGLAFEFVNGFHDAANAIATVVATRVLKPRTAVLMAGVLNVIGAFSGLAVAATIGKGIVDPAAITLQTVAVTLVGAIVWDLITWYWGLPSSSSHALVFSLIGASVATAGWKAVVWAGTERTLLGIVSSPTLGLLFGFALLVLVYRICFRLRLGLVNRVFARLQVVSSAYMAFSHGNNDGQKTMGIITLALIVGGYLDGKNFTVPYWVILSAALAMGLGTAMGGWRIIKTMGHGLVKLDPMRGFAAEVGAGTVIEIASHAGIPISTTHATSGAILGVGAADGVRKVKWTVVGRILGAWVCTIPGCFALGYAGVMLLHLVGR
jgi:PiT family inorganic phosphate transporter